MLHLLQARKWPSRCGTELFILWLFLSSAVLSDSSISYLIEPSLSAHQAGLFLGRVEVVLGVQWVFLTPSDFQGSFPPWSHRPAAEMRQKPRATLVGFCLPLFPLHYRLTVTTQFLSAIHSYPGVSGRDSEKPLSCSPSHTCLQRPLEISRIAGALRQPSNKCWGDQSPRVNLWPRGFI